MRKHEKIVWVPDIPDLDEVVPSAMRLYTAWEASTNTNINTKTNTIHGGTLSTVEDGM